MNLLLIHAYFLPPNAPGSVRWNEMSRLWAEAGHQLTVIAGNIDYTTGQPYQYDTNCSEEAYSTSHLIRVPMSRQYQNGSFGRIWAYFVFFFTSLWAGLKLRHQHFDVVIATSPPLTIGLTGWLLARLWRKPLLLEIRDLWPDAPIQMGYVHNWLARWLAYGLEAFLYHQANHIVVLTPAFQQWLITRKQVDVCKITIIPNGADFQLTEDIAHSLDVVAFRRQHDMMGGFWVVYAGAHGLANGLLAMLRVAKKLQQTPVQFLFIGDGPEKNRLQAEAQRLQVTNVRFADAYPKKMVLSFILAADAGLVMMQPLPIFDTMLSAKLFDYFACRKPVLSGIGGLSRNVVESANAGQYIDPAQPEDWVQKLSVYFQQPEVGRQQGENGYQLARKQFDRERLATRYLDVISQLVNA